MAIIMIKKQIRLPVMIHSLLVVFARRFLALFRFDIIIYSWRSCNPWPPFFKQNKTFF
jgi:hypothetical protein